MKKVSHFLIWTPEIILIVEVLFYWLFSSPLNPIAATLLLTLVLQLIFKNKAAGLTISILFLVLNLYMCLALISELKEFTSWTDNARLMLLWGGTMIGFSIIASILMLIKWIKRLPTNFQASN